MPALSFRDGSWVDFPRGYEAWLDDHFGFRSQLVRWHNLVKFKGLGVSPTPDIVLGKDEWIFTTVNHSVPTFRGVLPFVPGELEIWQEILEERDAWCRERGIRYVFAVAPNKSSIYPENYPPRLNPVGPSRHDELMAWMREHSDFEVLDLRTPLHEHKTHWGDDKPIYYPLGTHWNKRGCVVGYRGILGHLQGEFPRLAPFGLDDFEFIRINAQGDSWADRMYMEDVLIQNNEQWNLKGQERALAPLTPGPGAGPQGERDRDLVAEIADPELPTCLMLHDSFGNMLRPALAKHFERIRFLWSHDFDTEMIEAEKPDIVLQLMVERGLVGFRPDESPLDTQARLTEEYDPKAPLLFRLGAKTGLRDVEIGTGMQSAPKDGPVALAGRLRKVGSEGHVLLPEFELPEGSWVMLRMGIAAPKATSGYVAYRTALESEYTRRGRSVGFELEKGPNSIVIKVRAPDLQGPLKLVPGDAHGLYDIVAIEARAIPR